MEGTTGQSPGRRKHTVPVRTSNHRIDADGELQPDNEEYEKFLNGLLVVYHTAKRASGDQRLKDTGRAARVAELFDELSHLCVARCRDEIRKPTTNDDTDHEFDNLEHSGVDLEQDC